jgi:hypothetical protein
MAFGSVAEFLALTGAAAPRPAERKLIASVQAGERCEIAKARPVASTGDNTVRASLLRLLVTGATPACGTQDFGVWLEGAWIEGELDLSFARARGTTTLLRCHFGERPNLRSASLDELNLSGSRLPGLMAPGLTTRGNLLLRRLWSNGSVHLEGGTIGAQIDAAEARVFATRGTGAALSAQDIEARLGLRMPSLRAAGRVVLIGARLGGGVELPGARIVGRGSSALAAQGLSVGGNALMLGVRLKGGIDLNAARIGGQLNLGEAKIKAVLVAPIAGSRPAAQPGSAAGSGKFRARALNADGIAIRGRLGLVRLRTLGGLDLKGARIGGQLDLRKACIDGGGAPALALQGGRIGQGLLLRKLAAKGALSFAGTRAADLVDDGTWPAEAGPIHLDGFRYGRITGEGVPTRAAERRDWLASGSRSTGRFRPQPYTQLARVFRAMGLPGEARQVLCWREREVCRQMRRDVRTAPLGRADLAFGPLGRAVRVAGLAAGDALLRLVAGYGYKPFRALWCLLALWLLAASLAQAAWREGSFAPNSDVVLVSEGWQRALAADCLPWAGVCDPNPAQTWANDPSRGLDWDSFHALGWGLDLAVPILDLGQTAAWAPSRDRGPFGHALWWGRWAIAVAGWVITALGAAAVTGLMQRDRA